MCYTYFKIIAGRADVKLMCSKGREGASLCLLKASYVCPVVNAQRLLKQLVMPTSCHVQFCWGSCRPVHRGPAPSGRAVNSAQRIYSMEPGPAFPGAAVRHSPRDLGGKLLLQAGGMVKQHAKVHPDDQTRCL